MNSVRPCGLIGTVVVKKACETRAKGRDKLTGKEGAAQSTAFFARLLGVGGGLARSATSCRGCAKRISLLAALRPEGVFQCNRAK